MNNSSSKVELVFAYFPPLLGGLVVYLIEQKDRFIMFHAMQGLLLGLVAAVVEFALWILGFLPFLGWLTSMLSGVVSVALIVIMIICIVKACNGEEYRLPVIGDKAAEIARNK